MIRFSILCVLFLSSISVVASEKAHASWWHPKFQKIRPFLKLIQSKAKESKVYVFPDVIYGTRKYMSEEALMASLKTYKSLWNNWPDRKSKLFRHLSIQTDLYFIDDLMPRIALMLDQTKEDYYFTPNTRISELDKVWKKYKVKGKAKSALVGKQVLTYYPYFEGALVAIETNVSSERYLVDRFLVDLSKWNKLKEAWK